MDSDGNIVLAGDAEGNVVLTDGEGNVLAADEKGSTMSNGQEEVPPVLRLVAAAGEGGGACRRNGLRGQRGGERGRRRCRVLVGFRGQRASLRRLRGPEALGQPLRESVGRRRRAARRGGAAAGRVFAREPEPLQGGGRRPRHPPATSRASGAPTRPWRGPGRPRREGAGSLASPSKIIKEEGLAIVRAVVKSESNGVPCKRVPSTESSNATRSTRSKRRK